MEPRYDWLNAQIERLQADKSARSGISCAEYEPDGGDVALLSMAAHFNGLRPGASTPDPAFVSDLGSRLREICARSTSHSDPRHR